MKFAPGLLRTMLIGADAIKAIAPSALVDIAGIGGGLMLSYGAAEIYRPAGWIVGGSLLLVAAWRLGRVRS